MLDAYLISIASLASLGDGCGVPVGLWEIAAAGTRVSVQLARLDRQTQYTHDTGLRARIQSTERSSARLRRTGGGERGRYDAAEGTMRAV
jgi:hypothetical protein